jgi:5,10-methylenetetrahydromethanopterin reductase
MDSRWTASLGVALTGRRLPASVAAWARDAERAGFGSLWIIEDYFQPGAFTLAGAAAAVTERITIGIGVVNPYTRHPAVLAMETAALAGIAPGRVVLGLGASNRNWIEGQMAIAFDTPLQGLREGVEIVTRLLAGERVTYTGKCFSVHDAVLETPPPALVPIVLGVKAPRALALAAEVSVGVHCSIMTSPAHVRRVRRTTGGARDDFTVLAYVPMAVGADGRSRVRPVLARYIGALHGQSLLVDAGFGPAETQALRDAFLARRPAGDLVTDDMIEALAVCGTPEECRRSLSRFADAGLDVPVAFLPPGPPVPEQLFRLHEALGAAWRELAARPVSRRTA